MTEKERESSFISSERFPIERKQYKRERERRRERRREKKGRKILRTDKRKESREKVFLKSMS